MKKLAILSVSVLMVLGWSLSLAGQPSLPVPVKVLLLPKFEVGNMEGDAPGEAQYFYEHYLKGSDGYELTSGSGTVYVKDGVALCKAGMGKISAALTTMEVLSDSRFDFSKAYILSVGCAGSAVETTVMGDVAVISAAVDYDLGHHADARELADPEGTTWFNDVDYDDSAVVLMDPQLTARVYALVKDTPLKTTEVTRSVMAATFEGADWAIRDPHVLLGTVVTSDNYWKGTHDHENALLMTSIYRCPDPFAMTEMEDVAVARAVKRMGMLERLILLRVSVNMDVFLKNVTPETLWGEHKPLQIASEDSTESADIFVTAMENMFQVGRRIIDPILEGGF